jgi:hypothetical protein
LKAVSSTARAVGEVPSRCPIRYTDQTTSGYYAQLPALLTSAAVRLLDSERLMRQMASLRRKLGSQGQDTIAHPTKAHDDLATAATVSLEQLRGAHHATLSG